jgi:glutamate decarboxylase
MDRSYTFFWLLQNRCVNMVGHLFNAPLGESEAAVGVGTVGSSEAIMLAGLAFKRKWQNKRKAEGKPYDKPNIVTGANVQVMGKEELKTNSMILSTR